MKKVFYEKRGRRYVPVAEYDPDFVDSFPKGTHIVMCYPGGKSLKYDIDPAFAPMIAAGRYAEDAICDAIHKHNEARPKRQPITERQRAAWEELKAAFDDDLFTIQYSSMRELAEAGVKAMQQQANQLMTNDAVRHAYKRFMLVCKLTMQNKI